MANRDTSTIPPGSDLIVDHLRHMGRPVTRENWLAMNFPDGIPEPWTNEHEAELPRELQLYPGEVFE